MTEDSMAGGAGEDATPREPKQTADVSGAPAPELRGVVDEGERQRVQQALYGSSSASFELGRYVITGTLGRGGMGVVFKAFDPTLDRRVALKVLRRELDEQHTTRLLREAQAMAKLSHPNVVQVYEVGQVEGQTFVAMELVEGQTLREWMRRDPRPSWRRCVEVFVQVGEGLAAAHERRLVHRDFKPGNAIIDDKGRPRVLDFGLARQADRVEDEDLRSGVPMTVQRAKTDPHQVALEVSLTKPGSVLGTPAYMPPEQMKGQEADERSDQFSFCVALWEAVHGLRPFEGDSVAGLMLTMVHGRIRPGPKGRGVPKELRTVLLRGLSLEPDDRWPSMEALLEQLRGLLARRPPWVALGVGLSVGMVALGSGLAYRAQLEVERVRMDRTERCQGARSQLDGIWGEVRRTEVREAILGTGLSHAPGTWERVEPQLDEYADAWVVASTEVCEASSTHEEPSSEGTLARMRCLRERKAALRAAVDVLAEADAKVVNKAHAVVADLPRLGRCNDWDALLAEIPPPEDPAVAQRVEELRERLLEVSVMYRAGRYGEPLEWVELVIEQAEALGYGPLLAEAKYWQGALLSSDARHAEAEQELKQAFTLALEHGHDRVALDSARYSSFVVGYSLTRYDEGLTWGRTALALAKRRGDPFELARSLGSLGTVFDARGEYEEAKEHHQRALVMLEKVLGPEHLSMATSLENLGNVLARQGNYEEAKVYYRRALVIREKVLGPEHPHVAGSLIDLGAALDARGEYEEAKECFQRALAMNERALGPNHPLVAEGLNSMAVMFYRQGELEEAKEHYQRALVILEETLGAEHPTVALILDNLGGVLHGQGEYEEAKEHHERALAIKEKALGAEHPSVAMTLNNLGVVLEQQGKHEEAKRHHARALAMKEKALGAEHPSVAHALMGLAKVALAQRDFTAAREHAERALSIRESTTVPSEHLADACFVLAQALWGDRAQHARAHELAERARDAFAEHGKSREAELAEVEAWLAEHRAR